MDQTGISFSKLSFIIPCYNEDGNIARLEKELIQSPNLSNFDKEFIIVDDGSTDKTQIRISALQKRHNQIRNVQHPKNFGLGRAIRSGLEVVTGDAVITIDSDLTFHPMEIPKLIRAYNKNTDCVVGSPMLGTFEDVSKIRRLLSRGVNRIYQILLGKNITSTSAIFRLYRTTALEKLKLTRDSFDINAEILSKMILKKMNIIEVAVTLKARQWGESKIHVGREIKNHLLMFVRILFWKVKGI